MKLKLRLYGDPVLRQKAVPVTQVDERIRTLARDMLETMHAEEGIGLAAQQVGAVEALCVVDVPPESDADAAGRPLNPLVTMPMVVINPVILAASEELSSYEEGCLSFPDIRASVTRPAEIDLQYTNENGEPVVVHLRGMTSRCVQHEMDHLNGVMICDRMSAVKRMALSGRLKRLQKETRRKMETVVL